LFVDDGILLTINSRRSLDMIRFLIR